MTRRATRRRTGKAKASPYNVAMRSWIMALGGAKAPPYKLSMRKAYKLSMRKRV